MGLTDVQNYIIGIIMAMVVVSGGLFAFGHVISLDNSLNNDKIQGLSAMLDKSQNITKSVADIQNTLQQNTAKSSPLGWLDILIGSAYGGMVVLTNSLGFMTLLLGSIGTLFGVGVEVAPLMGLIALVATVVIVFAIWMAIMRVVG